MCGIAGFSLVEGSKVNARQLANALLSEAESRGTDAAGFAYTKRNGDTGMFKKDISGSKLSLKQLPRDADAVILHTRFATQGHQSKNWNNHPQESPTGRIRLVHNGHVSNDLELREILLDGHLLPEVDTSVIPAVIEQYTVEGTALIAGYAAVAWLDDETSNTIHLSRLDTSPVAIARLVDGSVVFASTEGILARALIRAGVPWIGSWPHTFMELSDGDYVTIQNGILKWQDNLDWYEEYYNDLFSSKAAASQSASWSKGSESSDTFRTSSGGVYVKNEHGYYEYSEADSDHVPLALTSSTGPTRNASFYVLDHDGDYQDFSSAQGLFTYLGVAGRNSERVLTEEEDLLWVNAVLDLGEVMDDGELVSWVARPDLIRGIDAEWIPVYLDGVNILQMVMV